MKTVPLMKRLGSFVLGLALVWLSWGCVNPYKEYYMSTMERWPQSVSAAILLPNGPATLASSSDMRADAHTLLENGYILLGRSKFKSPMVDETQALQQAQTIGAWLVLVSSKYDKTITVQVPQIVTSPDQTVTNTRTFVNHDGEVKTVTDTQTIQGTTQVNLVPEDVDYYDYAATYWAKTKPSPIGVLVKGPSTDPLKKAAFTQGVQVKIVVANSPAAEAGIQEGDILLALAGEKIVSADQFFDAVNRNAGQTVTMTLTRGGQPMSLSVALNAAE